LRTPPQARLKKGHGRRNFTALFYHRACRSAWQGHGLGSLHPNRGMNFAQAALQHLVQGLAQALGHGAQHPRLKRRPGKGKGTKPGQIVGLMGVFGIVQNGRHRICKPIHIQHGQCFGIVAQRV